MGSERLLNLVAAAAVAVKDLLDETVSGVAGLKGEASAALLTVGTRPARPIEDLRRTLGLTHSGTVRLVDRLQERGWVKRVAAAGGRSVLLELTPAGAGVFERLLAARRAALSKLMAPLSAPARDALEGALAPLLGGMPASRAEAWRICRLCEHDVCRGAACPVGSAVGEGEEAPC